jgi:hypothetical protein
VFQRGLCGLEIDDRPGCGINFLALRIEEALYGDMVGSKSAVL